MDWKGREKSANIQDLRNDPIAKLITTIEMANQPTYEYPRMGEGEYTPIPGQPLGWDYETLDSLLYEMGYSISDLTDERQLQLMDELERGQAQNNDKGKGIVKAVLSEWDPNNEPVRGLFPVEYEDQDGYWDAPNMGNGQGRSYQYKDGKLLEADPVGKQPMESLLHEFLMGLRK